ncbi:hypothetical protein E2320_002947, partial [Naja naja]
MENHTEVTEFILIGFKVQPKTGFTFSLSFCDSLVIDHFFCDVPAVMKISCSATFVNEFVLLS